jgi:predicted small secreted protein
MNRISRTHHVRHIAMRESARRPPDAIRVGTPGLVGHQEPSNMISHTHSNQGQRTTREPPRSAMLALFLAVLAALGLSLAACHTVEGAGKDIQDAGDAIEDAAD